MKLRPEHFDWLGFGSFSYIFLYALYIVTNQSLPPAWATNGLALIAVAGIIIDGTVVYNYFLKKEAREKRELEKKEGL